MAKADVILDDSADSIVRKSNIDNIQVRRDGSYVVSFNGYPYHATKDDTPDVYEQIQFEIKNGAAVSDYVESEVSQPTPLEVATYEYNRLRAIVDFEIAPLQDAIDDGTATDIEKTKHSAWRTYRISLNRVRSQPEYPDKIKWPTSP